MARGVESSIDMCGGWLIATLLLSGVAFGSTEASLTVNTANGQTKFRQGEIIPLELSFTAAAPKRFSINMASYDRSGRMGYETFVTNPAEGTADPIAVYYKAFRGFIGGGLTSYKYLSAAPVVIHLQLNQWVRFDKPGTYHVSVISHRVMDQGVSGQGSKARELRSNEITLEILVADAAWQQGELARIRAALDQHPPMGAPQADSPRTMALQALRYLGTGDAAREMASLLRLEDNETQFQCLFGLLGSPSRSDGLAEMRRLLGMPDFPVTEQFLSTMSLLSLDPSSASEALPRQREEKFKQFAEELLGALPGKTGTALVLSTDTAMSATNNAVPSDARQKMSQQLVASFSSLPMDARIKWLQWRWNEVKGDEWIPLLRQIASEYTDFPIPNEMHAYQSRELSAAALTNWYQLDPSGARGAVITEMKRPKPRFSGETLGFLPDKTLPDAEQTIAQHFIKTDDYNAEANLAGLLFRYGDGDVLPVVLPKIQSLIGRWACAPQKNALAYVMKVDAGAARPLVDHALSARGQTGCWHTVLTDVGEMQPSAVLEEFAMAALRDSDSQLGTDAARYLGLHGSAAAELALWTRYVSWSHEWKGRDAELRFSPLGPQTHVWDANLADALASALATGQGWFADELRLQEIGSLATQSIKRGIDADISEASQQPVKIQYLGSTPPHFQVAQYETRSLDELKQKLTQFPRTTLFVFSGPVQEKDEPTISELKAWANEANIRISGLEVNSPSH